MAVYIQDLTDSDRPLSGFGAPGYRMNCATFMQSHLSPLQERPEVRVEADRQVTPG